jgi:hypothetical protein
MKSLSSLVIAASALAVSITTLAQDGNRPVTRADMHGQVGQAEQQGTLHQSQIHHPPDQRPPRDTTGYGPSIYGSTQSSIGLPVGTVTNIYSHH